VPGEHHGGQGENAGIKEFLPDAFGHVGDLTRQRGDNQ